MAVKKLKKSTRGHPTKKWKSKKISQKPIENTEPKVRPKQKKTLLIEQEIKFARKLASMDARIRSKMLKKLRSWITVRSKSTFAFTETDFLRLWKGLFYCMWMSDKPLVQEELAESLSQLIHCFDTIEIALLYTKCTLQTLSTEWFGIDHYRVDKFEMLVRRIIRQTFVMCKNKSWGDEWVKGFAKILENILLDPAGSLGLKFHITELYMEELAKISQGEIPEDMVTELLRPFAVLLASMTDNRQIRNVMKHIFRYLIFQSDIGLDYMEKFKAWSKAGFPTGSIDAMEKVSLSDDENEPETDEDDDGDNDDLEKSSEEINHDKPLDPRAGKVDVELPQVPFNPQQIANLIEEYKFHPSSTPKTRRQIVRLIREFNDLAQGTMPVGVKKVRVPNRKSAETNPKNAALKLIDFEDELYADTARRLKRKKLTKKIIELEKKNVSVDNVKQKKAKKRKLNTKSNESNGIECESDKEQLNGKVNSTKKIKSSPIEETTSISNDIGNKKSVDDDLKQKKKSLQKDLKLKSKKIKANKSRGIKENINAELLDGIDDFADFKKLSTPLKKKKIKYDLNNSWDVSNNESLPTPTISKLSTLPATPVNTAIVEKSVEQTNILPVKPAINKVPGVSPVIKKLETEKEQTITPTKFLIPLNTGSSSKKRVKIVLQKNTAQNTSEYIQQLRLSPAIPFDANRKPPAGVLKPSPISSPINPFYKKL